MGLHDYETELEAAAVLSRIAAAQSSDPASDDLTVPLAFECAEKDVEIERLRAALIQVRGFAKVMDERNWLDLRLHIERQCDALEQRGP